MPRDILPASAQVTLSTLRAQNSPGKSVRIWLPRKTRSRWFYVTVCFTLRAPRVLGKGLLLGQQIIHGGSPENIWRCSINSQMGTL